MAREALNTGGVLDTLQLGLDTVGFVPGYGAVADALNAGVSLARGDFEGAVTNAVGILPFGNFAKLGVKSVDRVADFGKVGSNGDGIGYIRYGDLDDLGRATKSESYITPSMVGSGSGAKQLMKPKGFISGKSPINHHRGHTHARDLGGDGGDICNLTTLESYANTPVMRKHEQDVKRVVKSVENVTYSVEPIYNGIASLSRGVTINAVGDKSYYKHVTVLNRKRRYL